MIYWRCIFFHTSGSHSWEGEVHKTSKQQHVFEKQKSSATPFHHQSNPQPYRQANIDLWPPFSVSLTTIQSTHITAQANNFATSSLFPTVLYIPQQNHQPRQMQAVQYMPSVIYQSVVYPQPSTFCQMQFQSTPNQPTVNNSMYNSAYQFDKYSHPMRSNIQTPIGSESQNLNTFQRPPSQATSVKADMGSTSASVVNRVSFKD